MCGFVDMCDECSKNTEQVKIKIITLTLTLRVVSVATETTGPMQADGADCPRGVT
eukprot:m.258898 g.258898  ORF g.258898 m.258898 type:complete len:55 (+) comp37243_c0_seq1:22-186(+)